MTAAASVTPPLSLSPLQQARALALPSRDAMLARAPSVQHFWDDNRQLLSDAWQEWEQTEFKGDFTLDDSLLDARLREAVRQAWQDPTKELAVAELWQEVSTGVFQCQFFNPARLAELRDYLEQVADAGIPLRPPYGIALNRHGAMLDARSEGYLAAPGFQALYRELMDTYMRPISRLLFPEVMGYDTQTFGFSIQYQPGMDTSLRLHTDASAATLNVNLNLPGEAFGGSEVDFYDATTGRVNRLAFTPGMAMLHRGSVAHAAQPITSGKRTNLVTWLYGEHMQIPQHRVPYTAGNAVQRWRVPQAPSDGVAPF
ncbi:2OG-Fe(II) oxygenase [Oceanisphaera psychrotolerans]|uniref:2OG-Fe(II) oxygenase n=1 Tax=Oceanisphaera psychrotolerans TaxID=1414654 RepID=A0A1J4QGF9_9GAMM|nr:2OG-Fe(II) oxygenase [Oceanisphaera psychrotolerans]OIN09172.1 2OG-Fe(II) oxygenase [Oceanisphaera psychrotolerans]